ASHLDSEIMIMDEVLAVGDVNFQNKCIDRMKKVAEEEGRTILYVSHNMATVKSLCNRCIVLSKGQVIFEGNTEEAIAIYMKNEALDDTTFFDTSKAKRHPKCNQRHLLQSLEILGKERPQFEYGEKFTFRTKWLSENDNETLKMKLVVNGIDATPVGVVLPGEGNILIFDNGGWAGYGAPCRMSKDGTKVDIRDHSRVLEIDPITLRVVWEFKGKDFENTQSMDLNSNTQFYSQLTSSAQRLPNGNTMICEGCGMRFLEVTADKEVVWEYVSPHRDKGIDFTYRAYRYPYSYVPQVEAPVEVPVEKVDIHTFRMPGAAEGLITPENTVSVAGTWGYTRMDECVTEDSTSGSADAAAEMNAKAVEEDEELFDASRVF
ncbi:MAG: hypothetical protein IIV26_10025, partial [Peptococcaceae bacterium]|nr:hypothetical protein [Peptococcaceae bacterium]